VEKTVENGRETAKLVDERVSADRPGRVESVLPEGALDRQLGSHVLAFVGRDYGPAVPLGVFVCPATVDRQ
jgi:hypothetical protein